VREVNNSGNYKSSIRQDGQHKEKMKKISFIMLLL